jgi:hypothetical protein
MHHLYIRSRDEIGIWSEREKRPFIITITPDTVYLRFVTEIEYWIDDQLSTVIDPADSSIVDFSELIATSAMEEGMHYLYIRSRDEMGIWSETEKRAFIVSEAPNVTDHLITAAEYFIDEDPGPGNGVQIPLPEDGIWDESEESIDTVIPNVPIGIHQVGIRFRDETGTWSPPTLDSVIVGPVVTITKSGNNVILDWLNGIDADQFYIYRSDGQSGPFTKIDSTTSMDYMDIGILEADSNRFYRVTFSPSILLDSHTSVSESAEELSTKSQ